MHWISVDERLPEPYERVLVCDKTIPRFKSGDPPRIRSHNQLEIGYHHPEDMTGSTWCIRDGTEPTHWMPLPLDPIHSIEEGLIDLDSEAGKMLGFTSDRFGSRSYLWRAGDEIMISLVASLRKGNFRQLCERILAGGLTVVIPTPLGRMKEIVEKAGYKRQIREDDSGTPVSVWIKEPL